LKTPNPSNSPSLSSSPPSPQSPQSHRLPPSRHHPLRPATGLHQRSLHQHEPLHPCPGPQKSGIDLAVADGEGGNSKNRNASKTSPDTIASPGEIIRPNQELSKWQPEQ
jgi:hypothetical protein